MADAATWAERVDAWQASGQTADVFCARRGWSPSTLRWWSSRLRRAAPGFVRVLRSAAPVAERAIEIEVAGARVLVRAGFDRGALAAVIDVLRGGARS